MPPLHQHVLADGEADAPLLLIAQQREMRVESIVRLIALADALQPNDVNKQLGERVTRHCAICATFHFEIEEQAPFPVRIEMGRIVPSA
jgi:hypothetical protein